MKLYNNKPTFIEVYRNWKDHGYGLMLCYLDGSKIEYVMFSQVNSFVKDIINKDLFDLYNRGSNE